MNILLNGTGFSPGRMGGVETYFRNLVRYLEITDRTNEYTIMLDRKYGADASLRRSAFTIRETGYSAPSIAWLARGIMKNTLRIDPLGRRIGRMNVDVVHHPFSVLDPRTPGVPSVLSFWDLQHEYYPLYFSAYELWLRRRVYRASAAEATRIIVGAEFTKKSLVDLYGVDPARIEVVPLGYGPEFRVIEDHDRLSETRAKYALSTPFMYYPAATWPHKNHETLFEAVSLMIRRHRFDGKLVLSGIAMQPLRELRAGVRKAGLEGVVKVLGYVPCEELPYLYSLARLLVFPSLFEGFGIPIVEAMACGCPVACSGTTTLPGLVGDAGLLFDPTSSEDMAEKLWSVWNDDETILSMRRKGLERVRAFDWEDTARKTAAVYAKAAGK